LKLIFCLWNVTSLNGKEEEFGYFINNNNIDIVLVTETWLNPNTNINFVNYDIIRCDSLGIIAGGVAIIINSRIKYHILPQVNISGYFIDKNPIEIKFDSRGNICLTQRTFSV